MKTYTLSQKDVLTISTRYEERYREYGYSPRTLDWDKGKQLTRFSILTSQYDFHNKEVLDIGCGFGDLNRVLHAKTEGVYRYLGVDLTQALLSEARSRYGSDRVSFVHGDFLAMQLPQVDYAIASGIFNLRLSEGDNNTFTEQVLRKAFLLCRDGFAFDFLSDKVDYRKENTFHTSPERMLALAYTLSRNVLLLNNYMPFEFSLFVFKDDSFDPKCTIFRRWLHLHPEADILSR
ncbi:MAG: class I SAM-dependent methyltransferase [Desulfobacteraceae bacterium]|nr:MAG: class I SAM-dependent methyltransferase [Desulfobacteraceae bacterium]